MSSPQRIVIAGAGVFTIVAMVWGNWIPYTTASLGRQSLDARDPGSALTAYNKAIESGGFPSAEVTRAMLDELLNSGRVKQKEWSGVIERIRENAEILAAKEYASVPLLIRLGKLYNELSLSRSDLQFLARAERVLQKAIQLSPTRPDGYYELGVTYLRRGESARGLEVFSSALELNVHNIRARWTLGLALISVGRFDEGLVEVENALAWGYNWDTPADLKNLTTVFSSLNRYDRLAWLYEQVVVRHPGDAEHHATLATAYARMGAGAKAKEQIMKAVQLDKRYEPHAVQFVRSLGL